MNKPWFIYLIFCEVTQKGYVGRTRRLDARYREHMIANSPIGKALRRYGVENFNYTILKRAESLCEAKDIERGAILEFSTQVPDGYNGNRGG